MVLEYALKSFSKIVVRFSISLNMPNSESRLSSTALHREQMFEAAFVSHERLLKADTLYLRHLCIGICHRDCMPQRDVTGRLTSTARLT